MQLYYKNNIDNNYLLWRSSCDRFIRLLLNCVYFWNNVWYSFASEPNDFLGEKVAKVTLIVLIPSCLLKLIASDRYCMHIFLFILLNISSIRTNWGQKGVRNIILHLCSLKYSIHFSDVWIRKLSISRKIL